jgi:hypothetical protein
MHKADYQLRDLLIHKKIEVVGRVVFVDRKNAIYRVSVDDDMPVENWGFGEVELYQKNSFQ